ncbi:amidase family protein [Mycoplasmopsis lipofaciens]|uniref:amidase family protein n=1 Tax=Mycoplasmopsis lipofaciens TaxID=114884 RepID=UPI000488C39F|nr:amidase family protein [Mycoplasmopsis lipofaciens]
MNLIEKGNFYQALEELKNDKNNAVAFIYENPTNNNEGLLKNAVFTIKQNYAVDDSVSNASSKIIESFCPFYNATVIQKLIDNGAQKIAKVHCDELALGGTGTFSSYGIIKNPIDSERLAGGSSSGSVATFTKNISFALGSDTGDSVRLPASYNGVVGFKPSYGAISRYGLYAYSSSLDTVSYFTHNVNDAFIISKVVYGKDDKDFTSKFIDEKGFQTIEMVKPQSIALLNVKDNLDLTVAKEYDNLLNLLKKENVQVDLVDVQSDILNIIKPVYDIISYSEASSNLANLNGIAFGSRKEGKNWEETMIKTRSQGFGKMVQRRLTLGSFFLHSANQKELFLKAQQGRKVIKNYYESLHNKYDLIVFPASADVAPFLSKENTKHGYMDYILTGANLVGNPSISIPWIKKGQLPINIALESKIYNDANLLKYSLWFENFLKGEKND